MNEKLSATFRRPLAVVAMLSTLAGAQAAIVKGTVKDPSGEPLIGVSVVVQGTKTAVATDYDGNFAIDVNPGQTLSVSYVGYTPKDIAVGSQTSFNIILDPSSTMLDETVVVGYATQKKVNLTGSVAAVSAKDIANKPVANTATLLQGRLPGLVLTSNGAQAGNDNPEIRIRGVGTFGNNNPMLLIDGVECSLSQLSEIPAADIESISVLKDAASAAIYGVRAANGVILVTTKRGEDNGKVNVSYQGSYTLQTPGTTPDYVDSYNWALIRNEAQEANSLPATYLPDALQKLKDGSDPDHYANTDWLGEVLRNAPMWQHHLSVSGAAGNTNYMASLTYSNQDGIMKSTGVERISFRTNISTKYKRFSFGMNAFGAYADIDQPGINVDQSSGHGVMRYISWFTRPTVPAMYSNGHYGFIDGSWTDPEMIKNPLQDMTLTRRENKKYFFNGKVWAGLDIYDGLQYRINLAYNFDMNATKSFSPTGGERYNAEGEVIKIGAQQNSATDYWWRNATWTIENLLTYNKEFGKHTVGVLAGHSAIGSRYYTTTASKEGFPTNNIFELDGGTVNPSTGGNSQEYRLQSFFGRVNYAFDGRYLFEFNIRHDGSSRMPKSHRYATFPSVSVGWVFSNEKFAEEWKKILSLGKIRASWGKLGNQEIGNYAYAATLAASGNYYFDQAGNKQAGMVQSSVPNEDIRWETTRSWNFGFDLSFLNNMVTTSFDYFDKKTDDILMQLAMPGIFLGSLAAPYQNVGAVSNKGLEWTINYNGSHGDWTWNAGFSLSHVKNKIVEMGGLEERISGATINRVGEPIGSYYALVSQGIYRDEAAVNNRKTEDGKVITQYGQVPKPGDIIYADIDGNGDVNDADRDIIGNPFPKFSYGLNLGATWKGFDLALFFQGVSGLNRYCWETTADIRGNLTDRYLDRWTPDNLGASMPRVGSTMNDKYSSFWLEDASYLRLKNLEFGYTFRQSWLKRASISSIRLYFAGGNLATITKLKHWDPEKSSGDDRADVHPGMRTYSFGLNVQF
ncbi:MAG: TonB-dependent receptor [Muribaculaceae bacterium]|nr:TonB-dependent receptor [Muribaculaceae bacterium]